MVATEVRKLAERSQKAAKEIDGRDERRRRGPLRVDHLRARPGEIRRTAELQEVAAASLEQSAGVEQVARAMAVVDQVTQRNVGRGGAQLDRGGDVVAGGGAAAAHGVLPGRRARGAPPGSAEAERAVRAAHRRGEASRGPLSSTPRAARAPPGRGGRADAQVGGGGLASGSHDGDFRRF